MKEINELILQEEVMNALEIPPATVPRDAFISRLKDHINELILHRFDYLVSLLYRMDIDEKKLRRLIADHPGADAAAIIAEMVIERQLMKIKSRQEFRQQDNAASDEEKW
jgi:hypothetical protein